MDEAESNLGATVGNGSDAAEPARPAPPPSLPPSRPVSAERAAPWVSPLHVIKPGQGTHVRWGTAIGGGVLTLAFAHFVWEQIRVFAVIDQSDALHTLIPVVVLVAAAYLIFWLVGRSPKVVDFLIATEGEMKKVNWSTRREVWGATKIVIVTLFALSIILAIVDVAFILFFDKIGVLQFNVLKQFFSGGST